MRCPCDAKLPFHGYDLVIPVKYCENIEAAKPFSKQIPMTSTEGNMNILIIQVAMYCFLAP